MGSWGHELEPGSRHGAGVEGMGAMEWSGWSGRRGRGERAREGAWGDGIEGLQGGTWGLGKRVMLRVPWVIAYDSKVF